MQIRQGEKSAFDEVQIWMSPLDACTFLSSEESVRALIETEGAPPRFAGRIREVLDLMIRMCNAGSGDGNVSVHRLVTVPRILYSGFKGLGLCTFRDALGRTHTLRDKRGIPVCVSSDELEKGKRALKVGKIYPNITPEYVKYILREELEAYHEGCKKAAMKYEMKDREDQKVLCQEKIRKRLEARLGYDIADNLLYPLR